MLNVFTDGACSNNGYEDSSGGYAFIIYRDKQQLVLDGGHLNRATNNIAELKAVIEGCKVAKFIGYLEEPINVYIDSAYIHNCYTQKWYKKWQTNNWINSKKQPVANKELWESLIPFFENPRFNFYKIKGHAGIEQNEIVDKLAVKFKENYKEIQC